MSVPGWYPDPGGAQGQYRYWDGRAWSPQTSPTPEGPPGGGGQPGPGGPGGAAPKRGRLGLIIGLVAAALVLALAAFFVIPRLLGNGEKADPGGGSTQTSSPTISAWNETATPTPSSPPPSASPSNTESSGGTTLNCPDGNPSERSSADIDGKLTGGGLVVDKISDWRDDRTQLGFAYDVQGQAWTVTPGWASNQGVAALHKDLGFRDLKDSARIAMECISSSDYYPTLTKREDVANKETTVSGKKAWVYTSKLFVAERDNIQGDVVTVIVVDTGSATQYGLYVGIYTIDDAPIQQKIEAAIKSLRAA